MDKAVISTGGKQYLVSKGDEIAVELLNPTEKKITFEPLLVFGKTGASVGAPLVKGSKVSAEIIEQIKGDKTTSIRYKAKKRLRKTQGHRQNYSKIKITSIQS
jgi:large subunit ribosomal protein L21